MIKELITLAGGLSLAACGSGEPADNNYWPPYYNDPCWDSVNACGSGGGLAVEPETGGKSSGSGGTSSGSGGGPATGGSYGASVGGEAVGGESVGEGGSSEHAGNGGGTAGLPGTGGTGIGGASGGTTSAGGEAQGGDASGGSWGSAQDRACWLSVSQCFEAASNCFEFSPWSDCDQIVDVCANMQQDCETAATTPR